MKLLAAENSSSHGSLAYMEAGELRAQASWENQARRDQSFFLLLEQFVADHQIQIAELDALVCGRGPGNFSGLRTCQAAMQGLALPYQAPVIAISSGAALAWQALREEDAPSNVAVVGDARRDTIWYGLFDLAEQQLRCTLDWQVIPVSAEADILPSHADTRVLSSEHARVKDLLSLDVEEMFPSAEWLGRLAIEQLEGRREPEPLSPIYLHPAVAPPA